MTKSNCLGIILAAGIAPAAAEENSATSAVLKRFDANKDGVLEVSEMPPQLARRVAQFDANSDGKLDEKELGPVAERLNRMGRGGRSGAPAQNRREGEENAPPAKDERHEDSLKVGDKAPDFTLPKAVGEGNITLSEFRDGKPAVLVFGSLTCPPFRSRMLQFDPIYQKYKDKVEFLMVYTREAHPESTIFINRDGKEVLETIEQTDDMDQRMEHAQVCGPTLKFTFPTVVDKVNNRVNKIYAGWPSRFVVVGRDGKIAYDGGPGPWGFQPDALEKWLAANLN